ncbi:DUF3219 family protein [Marinococcus luteus]|uniref:DUF3219 family protein n=1 Tax=Marinococcus luteus TaxID=1122204 RepID=UPI002ACCA12E|nr:DUF3219 family protein [Marinococcus luteus]MDZ5782463.1 DUF3219 family protein [Marinococcus luteus]
MIYINSRAFHEEALLRNDRTEEGKRLVEFTFQVTHEEYHDVTVLLYENDFNVQVGAAEPFRAEILQYSTDTVNLYEPGSRSLYTLALIEK